MGSFGVVVFSPAFDDDLGLAQGIEYLTVEQLVYYPAAHAKHV